MLKTTTDSFKKLKNRNAEYIEFAKNLKYKKEMFYISELTDRLDKELIKIIKLKKQINDLKNNILNKIKNSHNKEKTKLFKRKLEKLTLKLTNCALL